MVIGRLHFSNLCEGGRHVIRACSMMHIIHAGALPLPYLLSFAVTVIVLSRNFATYLLIKSTGRKL